MELFPGVGEWGVYSSEEGHSGSMNPWHAPVFEGAKEAPTGYSQQEDVGGLSCPGTGSRGSYACMLSCFRRVHIVRTKVHIVKAVVFPVVRHGCESWTVKKAECQRTDVFELWC